MCLSQYYGFYLAVNVKVEEEKGGGKRERAKLSRKMVTTTWVLRCPDGPFSGLGAGGPQCVPLEVPLWYSPSPGCPPCVCALPTTWDCVCVRTCFFSHSLPWWEFMSRKVIQICLTRPGIFLLLSAFSLQWHFVWRANSNLLPQCMSVC